MIYKWKEGAHQRLNAQVVGEEIERIRTTAPDGRVTPESTVDAARPESSPIHEAFEWNDAIAAEKHRVNQAREILRCVVVVPDASLGETAPTSIRAFVVVGEQHDEAYTATYVAMSDAQMRDQVLQRALRELRQWRERYKEFEELARIFAAMDAQAA